MTDRRCAGTRVRRLGRGRLAFSALCVLGLVAAGCGDDDGESSGGDSATTGAGGSTGSATTAAAEDEGCTTERAGGELTFAAYLLTISMDPTVSYGSASTGAIELAAVYDTLMQYDDTTGTFVPRLAESLKPNADFTEWTLKLRPNIKFGNGDPFTTAAVKASIARHIDPANRSTSMVDASSIQEMTIVDDLTMVFKLKAAWGTFPFLLADNTGLIINPKVLEQLGKEKFGTAPVGAGVGPYEVESFAAGEEIVLKAKDDYWRGPVCIDTIRVIDIPDEQGTYDALKTGEVDVIFSENARIVAEAEEEGYGQHIELDHMGHFILLNNGVNASKPDTRDVKVRQAIALAIDADELTKRLFEDAGKPSTTIIYKGTPLDPGVPGPAYDLEKAKAKVAEAKAGGWDGSLNLVCGAAAPEVPIAVEAMLKAAGINVTTELLQGSAIVQRVNIEGNYEITCSSVATFDASPFIGLNRWFGPGNFFTGYNDAAFNAGLVELRKASTQAEQKKALVTMQQLWNETVPGVVYGASPWTQIWGERVHGLTFNLFGGMYFTDAWVDQ